MQDKNFVKGVVYETTLWKEESTGKYFTKCLKCGNVEYMDENHYKCSVCGEEFGDYHKEFITADAVEELAWSYLKGISNKTKEISKINNIILSIVQGDDVSLDDILESISKLSKYHVGYTHMFFNENLGDPVESEVDRDTIMFNGVEYPDYTWKVAFIVCDELFEQIKNGEINSFSFGGFGNTMDLFEVEVDD